MYLCSFKYVAGNTDSAASNNSYDSEQWNRKDVATSGGDLS